MSFGHKLKQLQQEMGVRETVLERERVERVRVAQQIGFGGGSMSERKMMGNLWVASGRLGH